MILTKSQIHSIASFLKNHVMEKVDKVILHDNKRGVIRADFYSDMEYHSTSIIKEERSSHKVDPDTLRRCGL